MKQETERRMQGEKLQRELGRESARENTEQDQKR